MRLWQSAGADRTFSRLPAGRGSPWVRASSRTSAGAREPSKCRCRSIMESASFSPIIPPAGGKGKPYPKSFTVRMENTKAVKSPKRAAGKVWRRRR